MHHDWDDNIGTLDDYARVVAGLLLFALGAYAVASNPTWALFLGLPSVLAGVYLFLTARAHVDPIYLFLGIDTVREHKRPR